MNFSERLERARGGLIRVRSTIYVNRIGWTRETEHICVLIDTNPPLGDIEGWTEKVGAGSRRHRVSVLLMGSPRVIWVSAADVQFLTGFIA